MRSFLSCSGRRFCWCSQSRLATGGSWCSSRGTLLLASSHPSSAEISVRKQYSLQFLASKRSAPSLPPLARISLAFVNSDAHGQAGLSDIICACNPRGRLRLMLDVTLCRGVFRELQCLQSQSGPCCIFLSSTPFGTSPRRRSTFWTVAYCWTSQALLGPSARQAGLHVQRFADAPSRR